MQVARVVYTKEQRVKIFGIPIFTNRTEYAERSRQDDTDEDKESIDLRERILRIK